MSHGAEAAGGRALRPATEADVPLLERLIAASARALGQGFYTDAEIEAAIAHVYGVDRALIADGSFYVAEACGEIIACGGWSGRRTLFGGDGWFLRDDARLDPASEPARIRAFFVAPGRARGGVGSALLATSEAGAQAAGFTAVELMATLPGVPFYAARGYVARPAVVLDLGGVGVRYVPMTKQLLPERHISAMESSLLGSGPLVSR